MGTKAAAQPPVRGRRPKNIWLDELRDKDSAKFNPSRVGLSSMPNEQPLKTMKPGGRRSNARPEQKPVRPEQQPPKRWTREVKPTGTLRVTRSRRLRRNSADTDRAPFPLHQKWDYMPNREKAVFTYAEGRNKFLNTLDNSLVIPTGNSSDWYKITDADDTANGEERIVNQIDFKDDQNLPSTAIYLDPVFNRSVEGFPASLRRNLPRPRYFEFNDRIPKKRSFPRRCRCGNKFRTGRVPLLYGLTEQEILSLMLLTFFGFLLYVTQDDGLPSRYSDGKDSSSSLFRNLGFVTNRWPE